MVSLIILSNDDFWNGLYYIFKICFIIVSKSSFVFSIESNSFIIIIAWGSFKRDTFTQELTEGKVFNVFFFGGKKFWRVSLSQNEEIVVLLKVRLDFGDQHCNAKNHFFWKLFHIVVIAVVVLVVAAIVVAVIVVVVCLLLLAWFHA